jgi:hypothetical protein
MKPGYTKNIISDNMINIHTAFPNNMRQLQRIESHFGTYDLIIFSYVVSPLFEENGFNHLVNGLLNIERLCSHRGRVLILQDKFQASLVRRISTAVGVSSEKRVLTQQVYPKRNDNENYTYMYYRCLYAPALKRNMIRQNAIA